MKKNKTIERVSCYTARGSWKRGQKMCKSSKNVHVVIDKSGTSLRSVKSGQTIVSVPRSNENISLMTPLNQRKWLATFTRLDTSYFNPLTTRVFHSNSSPFHSRDQNYFARKLFMFPCSSLSKSVFTNTFY